MAQQSRVKLFAPFTTRDRSILKDSRLYNGFVEQGAEEGEVWVYKRPGLKLHTTTAAGTGLGVTNWNDDVFHITTAAGGTLYKNGVSVGAVNTSSPYTFTSTLGATPKLFLKNRTFAYVYDTASGLVQVTDVDYPASTAPGCAYLDGFVFVLKESDASIHGSAINDALTWDPVNVILVQIEPEAGVALSKQLVYVVALKNHVSSEVFYDAGNATGSPLGPVQGSKMGQGCLAADSVVRIGDDLGWIATSSEGSVQVIVMSRVKPQPVSNAPVERVLEVWDYTTIYAWACRSAGHRYYGITSKLSNQTFVFDLTIGTWYIWTDAAGNYFPIVSSAYTAEGPALLQHETDGCLYTLDLDTLSDPSGTIPFKLYTAPFDGGVRTQKTTASWELVADRIATSLDVSWSDDDYQTFTTAMAIDLDQDRPLVQDGSSFRQRAFLLAHAAATRLRIKAIEPMVSAGSL